MGGNAMRAVGLLPALTGNVGKPGSGFLYLNTTPGIFGADFGWLVGASLLREPPASVSHMGLAAELEDPGKYRAFLAWNTNPLASAPEQDRLRRSLAREDLFCVAVDCFPTDTTDYADVVLPAASFLEFDDLTFSYMSLVIGAQARASEPLGESLPNMEIFRRLAKAMGYVEDALFESDTSMLDALVGQMGLNFDFAELKRRGHHLMAETPLILHRDLRFPTPSGKIEIASESAEKLGLPRIPQPRADAAAGQGRLRLLSPASRWRLNDSFANDEKLASQAGSAHVVLHPEDAARFGVRDGARVRLHNKSGSLELEARVGELAPPGVAVSYKGRWPKLEQGGANVNVLHTGVAADMGGSTAVHSTEVSVTPL
jgi:anaerobic selenocysteine-containing dehydrogenase